MASRFTLLWQRAKNMVNRKDIHHNRSETGKEEAQNPVSTAESSVVKSSTTCMFTWASRPADKLMVHGFETQILSLKKLLGERENDTHFKAVGVVGVRGVGKTALCQVCFYTDDDSPSPKVWIRVAKLTKGELLRGALERLGVEETISYSKNDDENTKIKALMYLLRCRLIGKKYLIVLDTVPSSDPWYDDLFEHAPICVKSNFDRRLACGLPKGSAGTVIVTSRDERAVEKMVKEGHRNMNSVVPLSDPMSLSSIFWDAICKLSTERRGVKVDMKMVVDRVEMTTITKRQLLEEEIKTEQTINDMVVKKSGGLPLAAKLMAKTMLDKLEEKEKMKLAQRDATNKNEEASHGKSGKKVAEEDNVSDVGDKKHEAETRAEEGKGSEVEAEDYGANKEEKYVAKDKDTDKQDHKGVKQGKQEEIVHDDEKAFTSKKGGGQTKKDSSNDQVVQTKEYEKHKEDNGGANNAKEEEEEEEEKEEKDHVEATKEIFKTSTHGKAKEDKKDEKDEKENDKDEEKEDTMEVGENSNHGQEKGKSEHTEPTMESVEKPTQSKDREQEDKEATKKVCKNRIRDKEKEEKEEHKVAPKEVGEKSAQGKEGEEDIKEVVKELTREKEKDEHEEASREVDEKATHDKEEKYEEYKEAIKEVSEKLSWDNNEAKVEEKVLQKK